MTDEDIEFIRFLATQGKSYSTLNEFNFRKEVFLKNFALIKAFKSTTSTVGINKFTDLTFDEY